MIRNKILKAVGVLTVSIGGLLIIGWLAWVPSAREPGYDFVAVWGGHGTASGQFNDPTGIAVTSTEVFISDSRNARIQVFDHDGQFKRQFGAKGDGPGQLGRPMNLAITGDELYVADYWNDRIEVFGLDGAPHRTVGKLGKGPGEFGSPGGVAIAANGDLIVADFYGQRIQHLSRDGEFIKQWGTTGQVGIWSGEFNYPTDVAIAPGGTLYVADGYNDRIQVFDADGKFLRKWGGPFGMNIFGPFNGWFATVTSVTFDSKGNVFVADFYNNRVQKFAPDGTFLMAFGEQGQGSGQFDKAIAVSVAHDGTVFVVDYGNNRIQKWSPR